MKKPTRIIVMTAVMLTCSLVIVVLGLVWLLHEREYHIHTEYGDAFTVRGGGLKNEYVLSDDHSEYTLPLQAYEGERDLQSICNTAYCRAYRFQNSADDLYILKIKKQDRFFTFAPSDKTYTKFFMEGEEGKSTREEFLCDPQFMEIVLPFLNKNCHDEMLDVAGKLCAEDYEELAAYGLTEEMIQDETSLAAKKEIMADYLREYAPDEAK